MTWAQWSDPSISAQGKVWCDRNVVYRADRIGRPHWKSLHRFQLIHPGDELKAVAYDARRNHKGVRVTNDFPRPQSRRGETAIGRITVRLGRDPARRVQELNEDGVVV